MAIRRARVLPGSATMLGAALGLCACAGAPPVWPPQEKGKLQTVTDTVSAPSSHGSSDDGEGRRSYSDDDGDEGSFGSLFGGLLIDVVTAVFGLPFTVPHGLMEGQPGEMAPGFSLEYPYARADEAFLQRLRSDDDTSRQSYSLRTALEYGWDFDDIQRLGATVRLETAVRLGLDASWSHFREDLPDAPADTLDLGDVNLTYRFAQAGYGEMRAGLGLNWFADGPVDEYGLNFTYGGDFYPGEPWITSFEMDLGTLGAATRFHGRATIGAEWARCEVYAGFDCEWLDTVSLPTGIVGMRIWF